MLNFSCHTIITNDEQLSFLLFSNFFENYDSRDTKTPT